MSDESGLSKPFIVFLMLLALPVIVYAIWAVQHNISTSSQISGLKDEVNAMNIPGTLTDTTCRKGDGLDSQPSCIFLYKGSSMQGAQSAIEAAGYKNSIKKSKYSTSEVVSYSKDSTTRSNSIRLSLANAGTVKLEIYK